MVELDRIVIDGMKVFAFHGVLPEEKEEGQEFLIDVELETDISAAAASDELEDALDYAAVVESVAGIATGRRYNLIESLASEIAGYLVSLPGVESAAVTVKKPQVRLAAPVESAGVTVTRKR